MHRAFDLLSCVSMHDVALFNNHEVILQLILADSTSSYIVVLRSLNGNKNIGDYTTPLTPYGEVTIIVHHIFSIIKALFYTTPREGKA